MSPQITETAYWMTQWRARASERRPDLIYDPFASIILENSISSSVSFKESNDWIFLTRTKLMDRRIESLIERAEINIVINIAAGFDMRPYRMRLPHSLRWIEIDLAEVLQNKDRIFDGVEPKCILQRVYLESIEIECLSRCITNLNLKGLRCLFVVEGLFVYLNAKQITAILKSISEIKLERSLILFDEVHPWVASLMNFLWSERLRQIQCRFAGFQPKQLTHHNFLKCLSVESLIGKSIEFKVAPFYVRSLMWFSQFWLPNIKRWFLNLSGIYLYELSIHRD